MTAFVATDSGDGIGMKGYGRSSGGGSGGYLSRNSWGSWAYQAIQRLSYQVCQRLRSVFAPVFSASANRLSFSLRANTINASQVPTSSKVIPVATAMPKAGATAGESHLIVQRHVVLLGMSGRETATAREAGQLAGSRSRNHLVFCCGRCSIIGSGV